MGKFISVVIPVYNAANSIIRCLKSMKNQTFTDFDIVLVDDCSNDSSSEVIKNFFDINCDLDYSLIKNSKNLGPSLTRKNGLNVARGEYICFCDSDDFLDNDFFKNMYDASEQGKKDIVFCSFKTIYGNGHIKIHNVASILVGKSKRELIALGTDSMCCTMIRKKIIENLIFPDIRNGEDMALIPVLLSRCSSFGFVERPIYNYVYHKNSLSKIPNPNIVISLKKSFDYIENNISENLKMESEFLGIRNYLYGGILNLLKNKGKIGKAKEIYLSFYDKHEKWHLNMYYHYLPTYKKVYLFFIRKKMFLICKLLSLIHMWISK